MNDKFLKLKFESGSLVVIENNEKRFFANYDNAEEYVVQRLLAMWDKDHS